MSYQPQWTQGDSAGRLVPGEHRVRDDDLLDIAREINLRRALGYVPSQQIGGQVAPNLPVRLPPWQGQTNPPFDSLRNATLDLLSMPLGLAGGTPASPAAMEWLWPEADADCGKVLVSGSPDAGQVSLLSKLNASGLWTDGNLAGEPIRAAHVNELRWCLEKLRRGRWRLPIYSITGIISVMPDTGWLGGIVGHNTTGELRAMAHATVRLGDQGLVNVTIRPESALNLTADIASTIGLYRLLRDIDFANDVPTWNKWDPSANLAWGTPGAAGSGDSSLLGQVSVQPNQLASISGSALATALQAMVDGAVSNFMLTRVDVGYDGVLFSAELIVEFELN